MAVLPTPASPLITSVPLRPSLAAASSSSMRAVSADRPRSIGLNVANLEGGKPERLAPRVRAWRTLGLVVLLQVAAELLVRFLLVGAEVADQGHLPAGPVDAG